MFRSGERGLGIRLFWRFGECVGGWGCGRVGEEQGEAKRMVIERDGSVERR